MTYILVVALRNHRTSLANVNKQINQDLSFMASWFSGWQRFVLWRPFIIRFALSYRTVVCPVCLSCS